MELQITPSSMPLKWQDRLYQVKECGITGGMAYATVVPDNSELVAAIKKHIVSSGTLCVYVHDGYETLIETSAGD